MIEAKQQRMNKVFMKTHLLGMPFSAVIHRFKAVEEGDAHDHPFAFTSTILYGGYIEQIFFLTDEGLWNTETVHRRSGDTFRVEATCSTKSPNFPRENVTRSSYRKQKYAKHISGGSMSMAYLAGFGTKEFSDLIKFKNSFSAIGTDAFKPQFTLLKCPVAVYNVNQ